VAAKISRQPSKIVLIGAPTSAASLAPGHEKSPSSLRAAGLAQSLREVGYDVSDLGDDPVYSPQPDPEHPRARNVSNVVASLELLRPRVELALKSGALPLILGGDCSVALAVASAMRRYHKSVSAIYMDRDADLNTPATTPSGCLDGMVVSHLFGRGAAELVRPWGEPPLVRETDLILFGVNRWDPGELEFLRQSPVRQFSADQVLLAGPAAAARTALERLHGGDFFLHFDLDVISSEDFPATSYTAPGGLRLADVQQALEVFVQDKNLCAFDVTLYNPERDPQGDYARTLVRLLVSVLEKRLVTLKAASKPAVSAKPPIPPAPALAPELHQGGPLDASPEPPPEAPPALPENAPAELAEPALQPPAPQSIEQSAEPSESIAGNSQPSPEE
jgi:arginase